MLNTIVWSAVFGSKMKTLLLLLIIALAFGLENDFNQKRKVSSLQYPEILTEFEERDFSKLSIEELIKKASTYPGLGFLNNLEECISAGIDPTKIHPDIIADSFSTTYQLIRRRGYPAEIHRVLTVDGYVLEMHRIPGSPSKPPRLGKRVAYLQHGILDTSAAWVNMGVQNGLGFILADLGYDVWLGNARGNRYSRKHVLYNPDGPRADRRRFWDFSWHEVGTIDLPTMIEHISLVTGQRRMHYVGHSQGTTLYFVMMSELPEYNKRIRSAHMLSPIVFMGNLFCPLARAAATFVKTIDVTTKAIGMYEFLPSSRILKLLGQAVCSEEASSRVICSNVLFLIGGFDSAQMNSSMLPVIMGHTPAGASTKQLVHYGQSIRSNLFRRFDHGSKNLLIYGSLNPPEYNLTNVRAPTTLYYSSNDWLSNPRDVRKLHSLMSSKLPMVKIAHSSFNHFDYCWAIDVKTLVYNKLTRIMKSYENKKFPNL